MLARRFGKPKRLLSEQEGKRWSIGERGARAIPSGPRKKNHREESKRVC